MKNDKPDISIDSSVSTLKHIRQCAENILNKITDSRRRTENRSLLSTAIVSEITSTEDIQHIIHELQVHQIELEIQNEELHKVQIELQYFQAQYFDLYEHAPVGYISLTTKDKILETNNTAAKLLGLQKNDLINTFLHQFIVPEDQDTYYLHSQQLLNGKQHNACELRLQGADNRKIDISLESILINDESGTPHQFRSIISDITKRKQAEDAWQETEELLPLAMDAMGVGFWDWDIANKKTAHNAKWYQLLGLNEVTQPNSLQFFTTLIHEDDRDRVLEKVRQSLTDTSGLFQSEHRLRHSNGHYIWVQENGIVVNWDEEYKPLRMVGSFIDISKRKYHEQQQRENQHHYERLLKLEVASQTIAAIAHELNQPLNAAASFADAAQRFLQKERIKDKKSNYAIQQCVEQIKRAGQVVHELFDFLHAGETITESLDLNKMITHVIAMLKEDDYLGGFTAKFDPTEGLPPIRGNALQLEKVLLNLIRNAIEAMNNAGLEKGSIVVTVSKASNNSYALVSVYDTGPGLCSETGQQIFEPFYTTKAEGLGMGLAISRALIEAQGGQLWYEQNKDIDGATFHLTIPFASETSL